MNEAWGEWEREKLDWQQIKDAIALWTDLERDALHIYAALIVQVAAAWILRRRLAHALPWICVLAFAVGNEWLDMYGDDVVEPWELDAGLHDLWNTMLLPTLLLLLVRFAPRLFVGPNSSPSLLGEGDQAKPGGGVLSDSELPLHRAPRGPPPREISGRN